MYDYYSYNSTIETASNTAVWGIIALVLAVIGGILVYVLFVKRNKQETNKYLAWAKEFLDFKKLCIEPILKVCYLILAIYITLMSFGLIGTSFLAFILTLTLGNIALRVLYELSLMLIMICKNTTEINKKLK